MKDGRLDAGGAEETWIHFVGDDHYADVKAFAAFRDAIEYEVYYERITPDETFLDANPTARPSAASPPRSRTSSSEPSSGLPSSEPSALPGRL